MNADLLRLCSFFKTCSALAVMRSVPLHVGMTLFLSPFSIWLWLFCKMELVARGSFCNLHHRASSVDILLNVYI